MFGLVNLVLFVGGVDKKMGYHSCWNHFRNILKNQTLEEKQEQHHINVRKKELMDQGYSFGTAIWIAVKEVKWDADIVKRL